MGSICAEDWARQARRRFKAKAKQVGSPKEETDILGDKRSVRRVRSAYGYSNGTRRGQRRPKTVADDSSRLSNQGSHSDSECLPKAQGMRALLARSALSFKRPKMESRVHPSLSQSCHSKTGSLATAPRAPLRTLSNEHEKTSLSQSCNSNAGSYVSPPRRPQRTVSEDLCKDFEKTTLSQSCHSNADSYVSPPRRPRRTVSRELEPFDAASPKYAQSEPIAFQENAKTVPLMGFSGHNQDSPRICLSPRKPSRRPSHDGTSPTSDVSGSISLEYSWPGVSRSFTTSAASADSPRKPRRRLSNNCQFALDGASGINQQIISEHSSLLMIGNDSSHSAHQEYIFEDPYHLVTSKSRKKKTGQFQGSGSWLNSFHFTKRSGRSVEVSSISDDEFSSESTVTFASPASQRPALCA